MTVILKHQKELIEETMGELQRRLDVAKAAAIEELETALKDAKESKEKLEDIK